MAGVGPSDPWDSSAADDAVPEVGLPWQDGLEAARHGAPAVRQLRNRFAVVGVVASPAAVVGAAFSLVGVVASRKTGGVGRRMSYLGLALSLLFTGFYVCMGLSDAYAAAWDNGCRSAMGTSPWITDVFERDLSNLKRDDTSQQYLINLPTQMTATGENAEGFVSQMQASMALATRADVRTRIQLVEQDLATIVGQARDASSEQKWQSAAAGVMGSIGQLLTDASALKGLCGDYIDFV